MAYFVLQTLSRWLIGGLPLNWDEGEALFFSRELAWGYGPQPPLYFWLQWATFQVLGLGVPALAILKNVVLLGSVTALYGLLRREMSPTEAGMGTLAIGLIGSLVVEAQSALTHTVLALLLSVVAAWLALRALERGSWGDYILLGVAVGLGTLSKLNFLVWALALLMAAALRAEWRHRLRPWPILAAVVIAALLNVPAVLWALANPELSTDGIRKLRFEEVGGWEARWLGTQALAVALLNFFSLPLLVLGGFAWAARGRPAGRELPPGVRLYGTAAALTLPLLWALVLVTGSTHVDHIWLMPLASGLVSVAALRVWRRLSDRARRGLGGTAAALWLMALVGIPIAAALEVGAGNRWTDAGPLAARLRDLQEQGRVIATDSLSLAGNIVLREPDLQPQILWPGSDDLPSGAAALVTGRPHRVEAVPGVAERTEKTEVFDIKPGDGEAPHLVILLRPD